MQSEPSLWNCEPEAEVLPTCRELGIGFVPYSPLGRRLLIGTIRDRRSLGADDFCCNLPRFAAENLAANEALIDTLAAEKGLTAAKLALAWVLHRGHGIVPIPGARKIRHLQENAAAAAVVLTPAELAAIEAAIPPAAISSSRSTAARSALR